MAVRTYNLVLEENWYCVKNELLTDKELEKIRKKHHINPRVEKIRVDTKNCYWCFGARFYIGFTSKYGIINKH